MPPLKERDKVRPYAAQGKRLGMVLKYYDLAQLDICKELKVSATLVSRAISGVYKAPKKMMDLLETKYGINMHWYLTGKGFMKTERDPAKVNNLKTISQENEKAKYEIEELDALFYDYAIEMKKMKKDLQRQQQEIDAHRREIELLKMQVRKELV